MKQNIFLITIVALFLASCSDELIQTPNSTKVADNFYSNEAEIEEAVNAVYATLQFSGNFDIGIPAIGEIPGEDAYDETPANDGGIYGQLDQYNVIAENDLIGNIWQDSYKGIQRANIVLNRITDIDYENESTKNARIGEMLFIRAIYYFNLVRIFGNIPLITKEVANPRDYFGQPRTSAEEVYTQIKTDLAEAIRLLPARTENNKHRVVKTAAQSLLGKVLLTLKDYSTAKIQLLDVLDSKIHDLIAPDQIFALDNELNKEIIFAVQFASGINSNSEGSDAYRMFNPTGRIIGNMTGTKGHGVLKSDFYNLYEDTDARKGTYIGALVSDLGYNNKIAVPTTVVGDAENDWIVLRYADVILMLAEIENELGNNIPEALSYINMIRQRAEIGNFTGPTDKASLFNEIDLQRRKELVWEGHRWFDLLRQNRAANVLGISNTDKLLMPIPASQIAADPTLEQNPGY